MPTYLNQHQNLSSLECRQVYNHIQTCPVCQQAVKNTCFSMQTPTKNSWTIEFNSTSTILLGLLLITVLYIAFRR
jgi:hypothetical protein